MKKISWAKLIDSGKWLEDTSWHWDSFTNGEQLFIKCVLRGLSIKEICAEIGICRTTVINAIKKITKKMEIADGGD